MIDLLDNIIMAGRGSGGWIGPLFLILFFVFINVAKVIAQRKQQQKLDEKPTDLSRPRQKTVQPTDYTTTRRSQNLPYAPKNEMPAAQNIQPRAQQPDPQQQKPVKRTVQQAPAHAQRTETVQSRPQKPVQRQTRDQKIRSPRTVQQAASQPTRRLQRQPRAVPKKQIKQQKVVQTTRPVQQQKAVRQPVKTKPAATGLIHLLQNSNELKKGIIYAEILGKPAALKDDYNV